MKLLTKGKKKDQKEVTNKVRVRKVKRKVKDSEGEAKGCEDMVMRGKKEGKESIGTRILLE